MEIKQLFGLPAHPLLVHVPIVLIPLVSIGAILMVAVPQWRARFGWIVAALAGVALVSVQLAIGSGEQLEDYVERSKALHRHTEMASSLRPLALLLFLAVVGLMLLDRHRAGATQPRTAQPTWAIPLVSVLLVAASVLSTVRLAQIGHNGAKASWDDVKMDKAHNREGRENGGGDSDD